MKFPARLAIFISGRGSNLQALLRAQDAGRLDGLGQIVGVVSDNGQAGGLHISAERKLPTLVADPQSRSRAEVDREILRGLAAWQADALVLAGYRRLLSPTLVQAFPGAILNIHPADPACFKGLHAYRWAFEQRLETTTVTVHLVDEGMDSGPILAQSEVDLRGAGTLEEVERRGLRIEHDLYPRALASFLRQAKRKE